ncbi:hypothetical protein LCGC14_2760720, partial [marine sediment metagenome]
MLKNFSLLSPSKFFIVIMIFFSVIHADENEEIIFPLEQSAIKDIQKILNKNKIHKDFHTLSPALIDAVAKSFIILDQYLPESLKNGAYLEFGIYRGFSIWMAQQIGQSYTDKNFRYFGFDSFCGLPPKSEDYKRGDWKPGYYACSLENVRQFLHAHGADFSTLNLIPGWFSARLFSVNKHLFHNLNISIIVIDSDVYEACKEILDFFPPLLKPGTIILFDEFMPKKDYSGKNQNLFSERRALIEFQQKNPDYEFMPLFPFSWHGQAFMITA